MQHILSKKVGTPAVNNDTNLDDVDPRILKTRRIVLTAAVDLLAEIGFQRITVENISDRSGVARSTIYRHWPNSKDLLVEAFEQVYVPSSLPDNGDLRADLLELCSDLANVLNDDKRGRIIGSLINASLHDDELAKIHELYTMNRRQRTLTILQRAVTRGDLPKKLDSDHVITSLVAPLFYQRFIAERIIKPAFIERVVDGVLLQISAEMVPRTKAKKPKRNR